MNLSDRIAKEIMEMLEASDGQTEIQRNSLAALLGCVPSQINYVITSRFTPENGFTVYSRRGGGGYIRIKRVHDERTLRLMHVVNSLGDELDMGTLRAVIQSLEYNSAITPWQAALALCAADDSSLRAAPPQVRDALRASIIKNMLIEAGKMNLK